jgi:hypothetical protein
MFANNSSIPANPSVKLLLNALFDYAGLFPPANLSMTDAVAEYAQHRRENDRWMTGPFVCTVKQLELLAKEALSHPDIAPIEVSLIPRPPIADESYIDQFREDIEKVEAVLAGQPGSIRPVMLELKAPSLALSSVAEMIACLTQISSLASLHAMGIERIFIEVERTNSFAFDLETACAALKEIAFGPILFALKIRCGGVEPSQYPSSRDIAIFLSTVLRERCSFKATAGLHHPVRHYNDEADVTMHGFLNVFFAALISAKFSPGPAELMTILDDQDPHHFKFVDDGIKYGDWFISDSDIEHIRKERALSIGSCSFDEPRQDLLDLGILIPGS